MSKRFPGLPPSGTPVVEGGGVSSSTLHGHASVGADLPSDSHPVLTTTLILYSGMIVVAVGCRHTLSPSVPQLALMHQHQSVMDRC